MQFMHACSRMGRQEIEGSRVRVTVLTPTPLGGPHLSIGPDAGWRPVAPGSTADGVGDGGCVDVGGDGGGGGGAAQGQGTTAVLGGLGALGLCRCSSSRLLGQLACSQGWVGGGEGKEQEQQGGRSVHGDGVL